MRHCCKTLRSDVFDVSINPAPVVTVRRNRTQYAEQTHAHPKITNKKIQVKFDNIPSALRNCINMHNAELYQQSNVLQKRDVVACLEKYAPKIKWKKNNNRIIDIGCGDGSVTNMLKKYFPDDFKLLGCDISESMVNFANENHCNEQTSFTVLDIEGNLPERMKNNFDNVFSFYALHWIVDQERAFNNIFNLLDEDGECFMIFIAHNPIYDVYRLLARNKKWRTWLKNVERYVSPYHDSQEPEKKIKNMMENIGFTNIDVECKEMVFMYDDINTMRKAVTAIDPFNIPEEHYDDFLEDYVKVSKEMQRIDEINNNRSSKDLTVKYKLLIVYGQKPSNVDKLKLELEI